MGTAEEYTDQIRSFDLGLERYHIWFALSFWFGTAILPPSGVTTIAGWIGGAIGSLVTTSIISGIILFAIRSFDDWRPTPDSELSRPETSLRTLLFVFLCIQLAIFGTQVVVELGMSAIVLMLAPLNVIVSALVVGDMYLLEKQGIAWESLDYGYAAIALVVGFVGGLGYWFRRGRKRTAWAEAQEESVEADQDGEESEEVDHEGEESSAVGQEGEELEEVDKEGEESSDVGQEGESEETDQDGEELAEADQEGESVEADQEGEDSEQADQEAESEDGTREDDTEAEGNEETPTDADESTDESTKPNED